MIKYNLTCECKCTFDSWFANSQEFERLRRNNLITCIECSSNKIKKSIMAPSVSNLKKASNDDSKFKKNIKKKFSNIKNLLSKTANMLERILHKKLEAFITIIKNRKVFTVRQPQRR